MKRIFLFLFFFVSGFCHDSFLMAEEPDVLFLSPERCGTHWLTYCITQCTKREWSALGGKMPIHHPVFSGDARLKPMLHAHSAELLPKALLNSPKTKLLVIIRDYNECLIRHWGSIESAIKNVERSSLFPNLKVFDNWDPDRRLMVHYEDLLQKPETTLLAIMDFLENGQDEVPVFLDNYDWHNKRLLKYYNCMCTGSKSRGKDLHHHAKNSAPKKLLLLKNRVQAQDPDLFEKYLSRYL